MNWTIPTVADRKEPQGAAQNDLCRQKGAGTRKSWVAQGRVLTVSFLSPREPGGHAAVA